MEKLLYKGDLIEQEAELEMAIFMKERWSKFKLRSRPCPVYGCIKFGRENGTKLYTILWKNTKSLMSKKAIMGIIFICAHFCKYVSLS